MRIGIALESETSQFATISGGVDFLEYGVIANRPIPRWVGELHARLSSAFVLHPLDLNICDADSNPDADWLAAMREHIHRFGAHAIVTDAFHWFLGSKEYTWPRTAALGSAAAACRATAERIAQSCGLPFRVENPPVDWHPGALDLWSFLSEATDAPSVEICLDISHLLQTEANLRTRFSALPRRFPWWRVGEIHLAGYLEVRYLGRTLRLDDHHSPVPQRQIELLREVVDRRGGAEGLDICLELEGREPNAVYELVERVRGALQA